MVPDRHPADSDLSLIIAHDYYYVTDMRGTTCSSDPLVSNGMRAVETAAGDLSLGVSRNQERSKVGGRPYGMAMGSHVWEILTVTAAAAASLAALLAKVSPIITALVNKRAVASVKVKVGDVEVELKGTEDVQKALDALRELEQGRRPKLFIPGHEQE